MTRVCTATEFGQHDYGAPPHHTAEEPRTSSEPGCQMVLMGCVDHTRRDYELVVFQVATHEWVRLYACICCAAQSRRIHKVHSIRSVPRV